MPHRKTYLGCPFCNIASGNEKDVILLYNDSKICAFQDPKPDSENHIVILSKVHIPDYNCLTEVDIELLEHMQNIGGKLLDQIVEPDTPTKMGFLPKSLSRVNHLHMHCLTLPLTCGWMRSLLYKPLVFFESEDLIGEVKESCYNL
ncbi:hypothetical protein K493DRAFT_338917 [Basidiobolus meristosporus CBS 931.73]|uniref:HIT domain-containing protein n=1 Tax=Basidiobolus meristosporus CBS 931.73 TaxID=1314790 RepID=A0A1Y1Y2F6_9FUNG|nr:hypothetical protein K493DRAFT_338917 [Basidiobolus meristosporus CBS 931.73]|eukprot:ORX92201.1 hypothetical protein K493DRAFT_338917 [Basidiobolus meristosporus CBS 931.73]